jgi:(1->4)-alpha-D-glucan 1-alpha-D-glucosylmutase
MLRSTVISATYRLQFSKNFTFQDATNLLDYLSNLGITHLYASPILASRKGSTHGYDVTDPTRLNPELGSEADFYAMHDELQKRGMGLILDIVPNHMSASSENAWWMDVLENGPGSVYAAYFDIDWSPPSRSLEGKILLPVLGRPFGEALESQDLKLVSSDGKFFVHYFESLFPLAAASYGHILKQHIDQLKAVLGADSLAYQEYEGIVAGFSGLADLPGQKAGAVGEKRLRFSTLQERLRQLVEGNADVHTFIQQNLKDLNAAENNPASFLAFERLLDEQYYVLAYWQNVNEEINYRRFFTINDLVGMRMQDPVVFTATHALIKRLMEQNVAAGLRIDHIDGLRDPLSYLQRLNKAFAEFRAVGELAPIFIFVEKILARRERLPSDWPAAGTTGYDFLNALNCYFVDPRGAKQVEQIYLDFVEKELTFSEVLYQKKKLVMATLLGVEIRALGRQLEILASKDRYARDIARVELTQALVETTAYLGVYRTYIRSLRVSGQDRARIERALEQAQARRPRLNPACFTFLGDVLLLRARPHLAADQREARLAFVMAWQQFTGPIMAKAFEDTVLYIYNPLISLNEVGGDPRPGAAQSIDFPEFVKERSKEWPNSLNATTTHDTKRAEDVRARINVLSEIPGEWRRRVIRWSKLNGAHGTLIDRESVPDRNEEILLYQTLLGMYPLDPNDLASLAPRLQAYAIKATREAMVHTRWTQPNRQHEEALEKFVASILKSSNGNTFLPDFLQFYERVSYYGMLNSLSQTLLKIASPGIPDFYQGSELWDFRLVDPDNRRPVDFAARDAILKTLKNSVDSVHGLHPEQLARNWRDGRIKIYLIWRALAYRRDHRELFSKGDFVEVGAHGSRKENIAAFLRHHRKDWALVVIPRWLARSTRASNFSDGDEFWGRTSIRLSAETPGSWRNVFTDETTSQTVRSQRSLLIRDLFRQFPVALLGGKE